MNWNEFVRGFGRICPMFDVYLMAPEVLDQGYLESMGHCQAASILRIYMEFMLNAETEDDKKNAIMLAYQECKKFRQDLNDACAYMFILRTV
jgi:hypothetical protein